MAETENRKTFPLLPISHWWALRKKFKQSIPNPVSNSYLATALDMAIVSARTNVLPNLKALGIIDSDQMPTDRAKLWRDDEHYAQVCKTILEEVYPEELRHAVPDPASEPTKAARWFANHTGAGENAVRKMVAVYTVLAEADVTKQPDQERKQASVKPNAKKVASRKRSDAGASVSPSDTQSETKDSAPEQQQGTSRNGYGPELNINLQIHISSDATAEQIEQIFASMSKHLYKSKGQ